VRLGRVVTYFASRLQSDAESLMLLSALEADLTSLGPPVIPSATLEAIALADAPATNAPAVPVVQAASVVKGAADRVPIMKRHVKKKAEIFIVAPLSQRKRQQAPATPPVWVVGETSTVEVVLFNPLTTPLRVTNIRIVYHADELDDAAAAAASVVPARLHSVVGLILPPQSTRTVALSATPLVAGSGRLVGVAATSLFVEQVLPLPLELPVIILPPCPMLVLAAMAPAAGVKHADQLWVGEVRTYTWLVENMGARPVNFLSLNLSSGAEHMELVFSPAGQVQPTPDGAVLSFVGVAVEGKSTANTSYSQDNLSLTTPTVRVVVSALQKHLPPVTVEHSTFYRQAQATIHVTSQPAIVLTEIGMSLGAHAVPMLTLFCQNKVSTPVRARLAYNHNTTTTIPFAMSLQHSLAPPPPPPFSGAGAVPLAPVASGNVAAASEKLATIKGGVMQLAPNDALRLTLPLTDTILAALSTQAGIDSLVCEWDVYGATRTGLGRVCCRLFVFGFGFGFGFLG
jgi:hypothetical protein